MRERVRIEGIAAYHPPQVRSSEEVEALVAARSPGYAVRRGIVETMSGIRQRHVAPDDVYGSDLAAEAARRVLAQTGTSPAEIDLLLYASAGQDLAEPATANLVQEKVGTRGPVFDVKNACNSFLNGIQVAEALLLTRAYRKVLVTCGETPSRVIKWNVADHEDFRLSFPGYTLGDAGAAAVLSLSKDGRGIFHQSFATESRHWSAATIPAGGSMHPRGDEWTYIQGDATKLKDAFFVLGPAVLRRALAESGTTFDDFSRILVHQVTLPFLRHFVEVTGAPIDKIELTLPSLGNMAAATLPVGFAQARERGAIRDGDRVLWIGLAGGISLGIMMMEV